VIVQVEAYNYRCLKVIRQPLDRFHVLIGRNGSGKSAFLDVLMLLSDALLSQKVISGTYSTKERENLSLWLLWQPCLQI
jgi:predicted ATPase